MKPSICIYSAAFIFANLTLHCNETPMTVNASVYSGYITGKSEEIVYAESSKDNHLSRLDWKLCNLLICGATAKIHYAAVHLTLDGWIRANASSFKMFDYDWYDENSSSPTHISSSPAMLENAYELSAEVSCDLLRIKGELCELTLRSLSGLKFLDLYWESWGGCYSYPNGSGYFPDTLGISYRQQFSIPYLGAQADWNWNENFCFSVFNKYSCNLAMVRTHDYHALRDAHFYDAFEHGAYWMAGGSFHWNFRPTLVLNLNYAYDQLNTARGNELFTEDDEIGYYAKGSGLYHNHQTLSLKITALF